MAMRKCNNCAHFPKCVAFKKHDKETLALICSDFEFVSEEKLTPFDTESESYIWECEKDYCHVTDNEQDELIARFLRTFGGLNDGDKSKQSSR